MNNNIDDILSRAVTEVIDREHLERRLATGERLRVKLGIDPTGSRLHLGHAVVLKILRRFQDAGHTAVLIIGDTTASIGDPSGKNETRPQLSAKDIAKNVATYERQALKILDRKRLEFRWQSEWFKKFTFADVIREASNISAGWITSHETFRERLKQGQPLAFHELLYPLVQAYDSVAVKADVELGGLDQKFNLLTGRELMRAHGMEPQDVVLAKYLIGTDGQKMGKSLGNFIAIEEEPSEMFGKIMSMPDTVLRDYFELATDIPMQDIKNMKLADTAARDAKMLLAQLVVEQYHGSSKAEAAEKKWRDFVANKNAPLFELSGSNIAKVTLRELLADKLEMSKAEVQRIIEQGGLTVSGKTQKDWRTTVLSLGKGRHELVVGKKKKTIVLINT